MRIGELARRTGCPVETIRYYERSGLLPAPTRTHGNYRAYGDGHVERLRFIRHCRSLDMTQEEIRTLLDVRDAPQASCAAANELLDEHIGHVAQRISELRALQSQLRELRRQCSATTAASECGIMQRLGGDDGLIEQPRKERGHVHGTHR